MRLNIYRHSWLWLLPGISSLAVWRVLSTEQDMLTLPEHMMSPPVFYGYSYWKSFSFCVVSFICIVLCCFCVPLFFVVFVCYLDFVLSGFCRLLKKSFYLVPSVFCCRYCLLAYHVTASNYYIPIDIYTYLFAHIFNLTWKELEIQSSVAKTPSSRWQYEWFVFQLPCSVADNGVFEYSFLCWWLFIAVIASKWVHHIMTPSKEKREWIYHIIHDTPISYWGVGC